MYTLADCPAKSSVVLDRELDSEKNLEPSGLLYEARCEGVAQQAMDLRPADARTRVQKRPLWTAASRLEWTFTPETFEIQTGEASVKARFCHQTETTPQIRQADGLHRSHDGGYQGTFRSSEAE